MSPYKNYPTPTPSQVISCQVIESYLGYRIHGKYQLPLFRYLILFKRTSPRIRPSCKPVKQEYESTTVQDRSRIAPEIKPVAAILNIATPCKNLFQCSNISYNCWLRTKDTSWKTICHFNPVMSRNVGNKNSQVSQENTFT